MSNADKQTAARLTARGFQARPFHYGGVRVDLARGVTAIVHTGEAYRGFVLDHGSRHLFHDMSLPSLVKFLNRKAA